MLPRAHSPLQAREHLCSAGLGDRPRGLPLVTRVALEGGRS